MHTIQHGSAPRDQYRPWISNNAFELVDKRKEIHFEAFVFKTTADLFFTPIGRSTNDVIDDLLILSASTSESLALSLLKEKINDG